MRINSINTITNQRFQRTSKIQKNEITSYYTPNFKASSYENEVETMVQNARSNYTWWQWNFKGAEEKERNKAKSILDKRNHDNEIGRIQAETFNEINKKRLNDSQEYASKLEESLRKRDEMMNNYRKSHEETVLIQKEALVAQTRATETLKEQIQEYQKIVQEQRKMQAQKEKETQALLEKMEKAREKHDAYMEAQFEKELKRMREFYDAQILVKSQQAEKIRNIEEIHKKMNEITNEKGFGKLAGYSNEKEILMHLVGNSIILEKDGQAVNVPNSILFFGPKGNGKTLFAESFAEQLDCNCIKIENTLNDYENIKNLNDIALKAQENFEKTGVRTILHIDEFDDYAPKSSKILGPLKSFLDKCSKKYHCTIFATSNFPEKIDDILLRDGRFDVKVPIYPANKQNALEILKFYGQPFADNTVNFEKLADIITNYTDSSFSNVRLKSVVTKFVKSNNVSKMTQQNFIDSIKAIGPDIKKDALELFKKQIEYVKHI